MGLCSRIFLNLGILLTGASGFAFQDRKTTVPQRAHHDPWAAAAKQWQHQRSQRTDHEQEHQVLLLRGGKTETEGGEEGGEGWGNLSGRPPDESSAAGLKSTAAKDPAARALILDVDGTLYGASSGVEQQIVQGIHHFFGRELGLSPAECNEIHYRYGSTIWGLQKEERLTADQVARYYEEVFSSISLAGLSGSRVESPMCTSTSSGSENGSADEGDVVVDGVGDINSDRDGDATGYQHRASIAAMICNHRGPIFVASNSPIQHVRRVLTVIGLADVPYEGVLTPDTRGYLTKSSPEFYDPILGHPGVQRLTRGDVWLLDDSAVNLEVAARLGVSTLLVSGDATTGGGGAEGQYDALPLDRALACFVGAIPHPKEWQFSDVMYLRSKNAVDRISRSKDTWRRLAEEIFLGKKFDANVKITTGPYATRILPSAKRILSVLALDLGTQGETLRVADLGCGLLPLLEDFRSLAESCRIKRLEYCGLEMEGGVAKEACEGLLKQGYKVTQEHVDGKGKEWRMTLSPNQASGTSETCVQIMTKDFTSIDPANLFPRRGDQAADATTRESDDAPEYSPPSLAPHVIVGCCLADLLPPDVLIRSLVRLAGGGGGDCDGGGLQAKEESGKHDCLVYLPITFVGKTEMIPSSPQEGWIPSDAAVLKAYDDCLREEQGHHTNVETLLKTIQEYGGDTMMLSPTPWRVSPQEHPYMWRCLMYFIGLGIAPRPPRLAKMNSAAAVPATSSPLPQVGRQEETGGGAEFVQEMSGKQGGEQARLADFPGWVHRAHDQASILQAHNVDLLFRLRGANDASSGSADPTPDVLPSYAPETNSEKDFARGEEMASGAGIPSRGGGVKGKSPKKKKRKKSVSSSSPGRDNAFLEFVAPGKVEVRHEKLHEEAVGEGQVLVEAICSSISSGTELKVFRGDFDSDSELDTTIKGMAGESMSYPLRYGYSLVGRVAKCGEGVDPEKFIGKVVFTFSPHSSWVVADVGGVSLVPEDIKPEDAVYLPAVETALSLVHDVHPRVGEKVAVFGQGMIGLLAVSILAKTHGTVGGGAIVAVDMIQDRLRVAERLGATAAITPDEAAGQAPFDTSLEVTGNPRGLQSALDLTGYGGRVVLGSWYGGGAAQLNLGMAFHRSHLTIQTSQVSKVPASLTDRWDKDRRFAAAWSLIRELKPSKFLTTSSPKLEGAQGAYESLGAGNELGVVFTY